MVPREIIKLIEQLAGSTDLHKVLTDRKMTAAQALQAMVSANGRREIRALRRLAKMHSEIVAHRYSPYAVHKLCQLLSDEKSEVRLKGALSILSIAGMNRKGRGGTKEKGISKAAHQPAMNEEESVEMLSLMAEVMERRRAERRKASE